MEEKDIIMEDKELNEQESLKLITQMIQNTRRNLDTGRGRGGSLAGTHRRGQGVCRPVAR